jgi:hypothetical protein
MNLDPAILDQLLKITQILFYVVAGTVAVLTYRKAKDTLLNTVNTEYQKKVIGRLEELAKELGSEFDSNSPNWWARHNPIREFVDEINEVYAEQKEEIEELGYYPYGYPVSAPISRLRYILDSIESDPFIPQYIRSQIKEVLGKRVDTLSEIYRKEFDSYFKSLLKGRKPLRTNGDDPEFDKFHNKIIQKMNKKESGISDYERQIHEIRLDIQKYLESFNPMKGKLSIRRRT